MTNNENGEDSYSDLSAQELDFIMYNMYPNAKTEKELEDELEGN